MLVDIPKDVQFATGRYRGPKGSGYSHHYAPQTAGDPRRVAEAAALIAAGRGNVRRTFPDQVQGVPTFCSATPLVYLSLFDPNGAAVIPKNVAAMPPIPFLWVVGSFDPASSLGRDYAFARAPANPKSRYLEVFASHLTTALVARSRVVEWIKSLEP